METQEKPHSAVREEAIAAVEQVTQPLDTFGRIVFLVIILEIILVIGLNLYEKSRLNTITQDLATKQQTLASADYATLNNQVNDVIAGQEKLKVILSSKINWANFYSQLDAVTPKDVRFTSVSISQSGSFKASGETATLSSLAHALVAWQSGAGTAITPFSSIALNSDGYTADGANRRVTFAISGQINLSSLSGTK